MSSHTPNLRPEAKSFQNSWSIAQKKQNYDALRDPHATYYFLNKSMKKHLSSLRKFITKQGSFVERVKITNMIEDRIQKLKKEKRKKKGQVYYQKIKLSSSLNSPDLLSQHKSPHQLNDYRQQTIRSIDKSQQKQQLKRKFSKAIKTNHSRSFSRPVQLILKNHPLPMLSSQGKRKKRQKCSLNENRLNMSNQIEHNKFITYLMEKKKKVTTGSGKQNIKIFEENF